MDQQRMIRNQTFQLASYFRRADDALRWVREESHKLPAELRPTHFSEGERAKRGPENSVANSNMFGQFVERCRIGFFLHGVRFKINVTLCRKLASEIMFWASEKDLRFVQHSSTIFKSQESYGITYGYAASTYEQHHRNQFSVEFVDGGIGRGLCGCDFNRYVPGLYWLNYFSNDYIGQMDIDLEELRDRLGALLLSGSRGHMLRLYDHPSDWPKNLETVDDLIASTSNFFSMRYVDIPRNLYRKDYPFCDATPELKWP
jgi:hypothetical protein